MMVLFAEMSPARGSVAQTAAATDHAHDFDWEFGAWKTDMVRLKHPLSGKKEWLNYSGTTTVRKVWGGKANILELDVHGPAGTLQALSLRLYDPDTGKWSIHYANSASAEISAPPAVGNFAGNKGVFEDKEPYQGREVMVMFLVTVLSRDCVHFEQSFSEDGGYTWEANWIVTDTRVGSDERACKRRVGDRLKSPI
jgi:hypothetical protein